MVLISTGQMSLLVQMYDISTLTLHICSIVGSHIRNNKNR